MNTNTRSSIKVLTIRGVALRLHISLLFLLVYIAVVAAAQFPAVAFSAGLDPAALAGSPLTWGVILGLALFVSVAFHEFGHVLVAQAFGVKVMGVTLMMLGGVSQMERMPEKRLAEFKLAVAGPAVSFALAGAMFALESFAEQPELVLFGYWVGRSNLILGIFNLLPAFPLDGGRALRSLLASRQGPTAATANAVRVSKVLAWVLGIIGLLSFNLLLALIAFFIYSMARAELELSSTRGLTRGLKARDVGVPTGVLTETDTLSEAAQRMLQTHSWVLPVTTTSGAPALVFLENIRQTGRRRWGFVQIREVMSLAPRAVDEDEDVPTVIPDLLAAPSGVLPLVRGGTLTGVIRYTDLADVIRVRSLERAADADEERKAA